MSCNSCAKPFSLLRKEKGCPSCGFSYCSKCLENKIYLSKLNAETKVCAKCTKNVSKPITPKIPQAPDAYYRRVYAMGETNSNLDPIDQQISERLQKLKETKNVVPPSTADEDIKKRLQNIKGESPCASEAELYSRLAKLKGIPVEIVTKRPILPPPDTRTEEEQANDLIKQYMEQSNIDRKYKDEFDDLICDMETRISKLKGSDPSPQCSSKIPENENSEDEEESIKKIVKKVTAEVTVNDDTVAISDELPFCEICNEDARVRCLGCQYLFCKRCFAEHKDDDDGCNRYVPYEAPKSQ